MRRTSARILAIGSALLAIAGAAALALGGRENDVAPRAESQRSALMLLTTLPLIFPEDFTLSGGGSKALGAIETRYRVMPVATTDSASLKQGRLLLMAHPLAQPAEALVDLDRWVEDGGRVLLLADPSLLAHWGLRLEGPESAGPAQRKLAGRAVLTSSPGTLAGDCRIEEGGFVARCNIGSGQAVIVADADFLNVEQLDGATEDNLDALLVELAALER